MTESIAPVSTTDLDEVLRLTTPSVWVGLREQSLFITGGTGFVGRWLLECLLHAEREMNLGLSLTVLTRDPDKFIAASGHLATAPAVTLVRGDVLDFEFPTGSFSSVIHAALPVAPPESANGELQRIAEAGARRVCEFAAASRARRLLHVSSGAVYGAQRAPGPLAEDTTWNEADADNDYTRAKRIAETVVGQHLPLDVVTARCFAFVGPGLLPSSGAAAAQFIEAAAMGKRIVVQGTGEAVRAYQYAGDMVRWLLSCLILGVTGRAYNIGSDADLTIERLASEVTRLANTGMQVQIVGQATPGLAGAHYVPDVRRARTELGLINAVDLEEGIRRTLAWRRLPPCANSATPK